MYKIEKSIVFFLILCDLYIVIKLINILNIEYELERRKSRKVKKLWGKGSTASQIAEIIGGISRNAVIGKAHRLNLSSKIKTRNASSSQNFDNSSEENFF